MAITVFEVRIDGEFHNYFTDHFATRAAAKKAAITYAQGLKRWRRVAESAKIEITESQLPQEEI